MDHSDIGFRMKKYEYITRTHLIPKLPVIIRVDGRAFHTFTRGFEKPFDTVLVSSMQQTMKYLCENIQGCVLGYTQSDEISLALIDYQNINSAAWFDYNIQKCASIASSMATLAFNRAFSLGVYNYAIEAVKRNVEWTTDEYYDRLMEAQRRGAMFDARAFNLPKEEVCNYFYWRQLDAERNSIQMVGQSQFSHGELHGKSCEKIKEMLVSQRCIRWVDYPEHLQRGSCCVKREVVESDHLKWIIDENIPIFVQNRAYIDDLVVF